MPALSTKSSLDLASQHRSWTETDWENLTAANSLQDLVQLAFQKIDRMPKPIAWVCGPITNGGVGSIEAMYFIPGWESSSGASWEHAQAQRLGMEIVYLPK